MFESFPTVVLISNFLIKSFFKMFCGDQLHLCALGKLLSNGIKFANGILTVANLIHGLSEFKWSKAPCHKSKKAEKFLGFWLCRAWNRPDCSLYSFLSYSDTN